MDKSPMQLATNPLQKRKRQREDHDEPTAKKSIRRIIGFGDLNFDCLEHIFSLLSFYDLLNVAEFNENTKDAAHLVFGKYYAKHVVRVCIAEPTNIASSSHPTIAIDSPVTCSKLFRIFGGLITKMEVKIFQPNELSDEWIDALTLCFDKSSKAVTELSLLNVNEKVFAGVKNAFESVQTLRIDCSQLGKCSLLNKWFPNVGELEFTHSSCDQILFNFPCVIRLTKYSKDACLHTDDFKTMIKSATQLHTLSLTGGIENSMLQFISEHLTNLKHLKLSDFTFENDCDEMACFDNVETLRVSIGGFNWSENAISDDIPLRFKNLKELYVSGDEIGFEWYDFSLQHINLRKLSMYSFYEPEIGDNDLMDLATSLPQLAEIDVVADVSPDGLVQFLEASQSIKKVCITNFDTDYAQLAKKVDKHWSQSQCNGLTLERND